MNWKKFKNLPKKEKQDEACFIIGIDLGNATSAIAYFDAINKAPEIIDISGGYGRPSVPTVMQYIYDTKEWVFGEYALLNRSEGKDITLSSLIDKLGRKEYVEIDTRPVSVVNILGMYLKELMSNVKNINPKAEIAGIIVSIPSYLSEEAKEELVQAFNAAGYEKEVIGLVSDRECIFARHYFEQTAARERVVLLDFGSRELRGGVYQIEPDHSKITIKSLSSLFDPSLGTDKIDSKLNKVMTELYCENMKAAPGNLSEQVKDNIKTFVYQHKDLMFQKTQKPLRLYFNFAYPPFQHTVTKEQMNDFVMPFRRDFGKFISRVLKKNNYNDGEISPGEISAIICTGGGFEMMWAREAVKDIFPGSELMFYKNSKCVVAEGASVMAAAALEVAEGKLFETEDRSQITRDIGIQITRDRKQRFLPIVERNSFWWQSHEPKLLIINEDTDKPIEIKLYQRDNDGEMNPLENLILDRMPERPRGTMKIKMALRFKNYNEIEASITDCGFGELFPATDYSRKFCINVY